MVEEHMGGHGPIWDLKTAMGEDIWNAIQNHPVDGPYKRGLLRGIGGVLNGMSHPDKKMALELTVEDVIDAQDKQTPPEIVTLALDHAIKWRSILISERPGKDKVTGNITLKMIENELTGRIPQGYIDAVFKK